MTKKPTDPLQSAIDNMVVLADESFTTTLALLRSARDGDLADANWVVQAAAGAFHIFSEAAERVSKMSMAQYGIRAVIAAREDGTIEGGNEPADKPNKEYMN